MFYGESDTQEATAVEKILLFCAFTTFCLFLSILYSLLTPTPASVDIWNQNPVVDTKRNQG
jgi:hypothetical protein